MRNLYFFALLAGLLLPAGSWGQPGFNQAYDYGYPRNQFYKILVVNDTVVAYGLARQDTSPSQQCLFVARLDSNGQQINHRLICDSAGGIFSAAINWSNIIHTSDGGYALTAFTFNTYDGMLVKLAPDFSIEFIQVFLDTAHLVEFYQYIIEQSDGFILTGYVQQKNYDVQPFIRKVDHAGNTSWLTFLGDDFHDDNLLDFDLIGDSILVLAGGTSYVPNTTFGYSPWILLYNLADQTIVKEWKPTHDTSGYIQFILYNERTGSYLVQGAKVQDTSPKDAGVFYLGVLDSSMNYERINYSGYKPNPGISFWGDSEINDTTILRVGRFSSQNGNNEVGFYGWLWAFSTSADSLWEVKMHAPIADDPGSGHYLGGVGRLSSGNLIAGGYASSLGNVYPWLVKITPDGCVDDLWCAPVVSAAPEPVYAVPALEVRVYPNPASGWVQLELPFLARPAGPLTLYAVHGAGYPVSVTPRGMIDVSMLPPGVYTGVLQGADGMWYRVRVVR